MAWPSLSVNLTIFPPTLLIEDADVCCKNPQAYLFFLFHLPLFLSFHQKTDLMMAMAVYIFYCILLSFSSFANVFQRKTTIDKGTSFLANFMTCRFLYSFSAYFSPTLLITPSHRTCLLYLPLIFHFIFISHFSFYIICCLRSVGLSLSFL